MPHDDPRLTAYALGELSPEESEELEARLVRDAAALAEVAAVDRQGEGPLHDGGSPLELGDGLEEGDDREWERGRGGEWEKN